MRVTIYQPNLGAFLASEFSAGVFGYQHQAMGMPLFVSQGYLSQVDAFVQGPTVPPDIVNKGMKVLPLFSARMEPFRVQVGSFDQHPIKESIRKRAQAYLYFHQALSIDTGDSRGNAWLKESIGTAMAQAGFTQHAQEVFEQALAMDMGDAEKNAGLKESIGKAMAQAGFIQRAQEVFEQALSIDTGDAETNALLKVSIGEAMAQAGFTQRAQEVFEQALSIDTGNAFLDSVFKEGIGEAMAQAGFTQRAQEVFEQALAMDMGDAEKNAGLKESIGKALAKAGFTQRAQEVFEQALAVDTGDAETNARLKALIGDTMVLAGFTQQALSIDKGDAETNALEKMFVGEAMALAGFTQRAQEVFEQALAMDTGDAKTNALLKVSIGEAMAKAGMFEQALAIDTGNALVNAELNASIGKALAQSGFTQRAQEVFEQALSMDMGNAEENARLKKSIGTTMAWAGMFEQALAIDTGDAEKNAWLKESIGEAMTKVGMFEQALAIDTEYAETNAQLKNMIGRAMAQAAIPLIKESQQVEIMPSELYGLIDQMNGKTLVDLGRVLTIEQINELCDGIDDQTQRESAQDFMMAGHTSVWRLVDVDEKQRRSLAKRHTKKIRSALQSDLTISRIYPSLLILFHLSDMGDSATTSQLIELGREASRGKRPKYAYTLFRVMTQLDSMKAKDAVLQAISSEKLPDRHGWRLLHRLIEVGYLDKGLKKYLIDRIEEAGSSDKAQAAEKLFLLRTIQYIHQELNLCPDVRLLNFILEDASDLAGVHAKVAEVKGYQKKFDAIRDRHKLVSSLAQDEREATIYFILNGGKTRYALVNNYDLTKFLAIVKKMNKLKIHNGPLEEFLGLFPEDKRAQLRERLLTGKFPVDGEPGKAIRVDVSDSAQLDAIAQRAAGVFGSHELGAVIKYAMYFRMDGLSDAEREILESVNGIEDAASAIATIDSRHPDLEQKIVRKLRKSWTKLMQKRVLEVGIEQIFGNERNEVSLSRMTQGLEEARGALANRERQIFKEARKSKDVSTEAARLLRDERLAALEEKARAKLLRFILQDMLIGKSNKKVHQLFDEWESHLDGVMQDYDKLKESEGSKTREKSVYVRYLDRRDDLIECARVADSAQNCFNSKNYNIQHNMGAADWIAMMWKDPLSFAFQIEDYPHSQPTNAIGFVFGSFGIRDGKPAVLLNGVYMESKTDEATRSVLNHIEQSFSRPLGVRSQFVAAKYAGSSRMDETYSNKPVEVKRLRAIADPHSGKPITIIYDDLNVGVNEPKETDQGAWHKKLD